MATYDEVMAIAQQNMSGMDDIERQRRQALIEATVQRDPELARMIASGPYQRIDDTGSTMSSQEAWQRAPQYPGMTVRTPGPQQGPPAQPQATTPSLMQNPIYNRQVQPSSSGPIGSSPAYGTPSLMNNPIYSQQSPSTGGQQPVTVNVNFGGGSGVQDWMKPQSQQQGYDQNNWYTPPSQVQQTPQQQAIQQQIYNPPSQRPPQIRSYGAAYDMSSYPYSPLWSGQKLNGFDPGYSFNNNSPQPAGPGVGTSNRLATPYENPFIPSQGAPQPQGIQPFGGREWGPGNFLANLAAPSLLSAMGGSMMPPPPGNITSGPMRPPGQYTPPQPPQQMSSLGAAYGMNSYPYSPQWAGIPLNGVR